MSGADRPNPSTEQGGPWPRMGPPARRIVLEAPRLWLHPPSIIITVRHSSRKKGVYSASGIYGGATLATRHKGVIVMRAVVDGILKEIEELRSDSHG